MKITLINNIEVEVDDPKKAAQFLHSLYWRQFQAETKSNDDVDGKKCKICRNLITGKYTSRTKYCSDSCRKKANNKSKRAYYITHREQIKANVKRWKDKQTSIEPVVDESVYILN